MPVFRVLAAMWCLSIAPKDGACAHWGIYAHWGAPTGGSTKRSPDRDVVFRKSRPDSMLVPTCIVPPRAC